MPLQVVTFWAGDRRYKDYADQLVASGPGVGLEVYCEQLPDPESWRDGLYMKAPFIRRMMDKFPDKDILWLDADSKLLEHPSMLYRLPETKHCAGYVHKPGVHWGCTLWFRQSALSREILDKWIKENKDAYGFIDDHNFYYMLMRDGYKTAFYPLPPAYAWHVPSHRTRFSEAKPVIVQYAAGLGGDYKEKNTQAPPRPWLGGDL